MPHKKSSKALAIWQKLLINDSFQQLVQKHRKSLGVPPKGFAKGPLAIKKAEAIREELGFNFFRELEQELIKQIPFSKPLAGKFFSYLLFNKINLSDVDVTGCNWDLSLFDSEGTISIKIGLFSTIADIKEFVARHATFIREMQKLYLERHSIKRPPRIRSSKNDIRDKLIYKVYTEFSRKELEELGGGNSVYKDIQVVNVLKKLTEYRISNDLVRKVVSKQRQLNSM